MVDRALLLTAPGQGMADPSPTIATLLTDPELAGLSPQDVLLVVVAVGRVILPRWLERFPQLEGPRAAVAAAEAWAAAPSVEAAESAVRAADLAIQQALAQWPGQLRHAAWAGRTAAWVAMAPKLDWPAVATLYGACKAVGREQVVAAVADALHLPYVVRAEPHAAADGGA